MFEVCKEKMRYSDFAQLMIIIEGLGQQNEDGTPIVGMLDVPEENIAVYNENPDLFLSEYNNENEYDELLPSLISLAEALPEGHSLKDYVVVEICVRDEESLNKMIVIGIAVISLGIYLSINKKK
mgnify:CR=1 FL=1|jgi:hypothetical protein